MPCGTNLGCSRHVCVALRTHRASRLVSLGRCTVHLQTLQLTALEAALVHDAVWPPIVAAIACRITCARENGKNTLQLNLCGILPSPKPQIQGKTDTANVSMSGKLAYCRKQCSSPFCFPFYIRGMYMYILSCKSRSAVLLIIFRSTWKSSCI